MRDGNFYARTCAYEGQPVFELPMRDGNPNGYHVFELPMRDGNTTPNEKMHQPSVVFELPMRDGNGIDVR